jgi:phage baseplate assembly protein V
MSERLMGRVRGMIARAVLNLVNDATKLQALQVTLLADQVPDDVEHFQHYGFTSVAHAGAEGIALAIGGSTGNTVVINVDDRRYRLKALPNGEVALYDDLGHKVHLTRAGIVIDGAGHPVKMVNLTKLRVEADIESTGQIKDLCDGAASRTMAQMRTSYTGHTHTSNAVGSPTSTPNQAV